MRPSLVLVPLALGLVSGCSVLPDRATETFDPIPGTERVLALVQEEGGATRQVDLAPGTRRAAVRLDCLGDPDEGITVVVEHAGEAWSPCRSGSEPADTAGAITITTPSDLPSRVSVRVQAPRGSEWSVALDAGPALARP
ncbi:hypothetical protein [Aeromicrobium sp. IC_218]|uniref:hypothetical protein n=1 Tax=Aeromicrobium sp. IC_218 TaxID=2545468 RepID=UPI00103C5B2D|nr:hypothetical protein [Aeromicrobium sp. IC_218]TCJ00763.1 hypothetical protein E0W78_01370 [Aeromicrobium sp. IC_218]